jgi:outer membrane immunogenic protein
MLGGRLGYAWSNWLIYGDGGGARSAVVSNLNTGTLNPPVNNDYDSILSTHKGWYAGAGVEYVLMKGGVFDLIGGLEYQHIDLGTQTELSSLFPAFSPCPPGNDCRAITAKDNLVRVRLSVKLNPFASPRP